MAPKDRANQAKQAARRASAKAKARAPVAVEDVDMPDGDVPPMYYVTFNKVIRDCYHGAPCLALTRTPSDPIVYSWSFHDNSTIVRRQGLGGPDCLIMKAFSRDGVSRGVNGEKSYILRIVPGGADDESLMDITEPLSVVRPLVVELRDNTPPAWREVQPLFVVPFAFYVAINEVST